jgi:NADH-quinone oxidoreductase subunit L
VSLLTFAAETGTTAAQHVASQGPWMLRHVWIIPFIPAVSFVIILFTGKRWPKKGAEVGIAALLASFILSIVAGAAWIGHVNDAHDAASSGEAAAVVVDASSAGHATGLTIGENAAAATDAEHGTEGGATAAHEERVAVDPVRTSQTWFENEGHKVEVNTLVDGLSVMMLIVVTLISLLVHIYSTDYVDGDRRYTHFFAFLSLFTASMLTLVIAGNTLMFITAWELVGVCSFVLISHWWEEPANANAGVKAFLTNRVGDMGLLVGMIILYFAAGKSFDIVKINEMAASGAIRHTLLLISACCLLAAVMSKSGQFFLHTWLPDAMAGPTPVSALIHAATMVVAGVFMIARLYPVFFEGLKISGSSINLLALIGAVTTLVGGLLAFVQRDIKKVLAYSTISQLGYMVMALGCGAWTAAVFHLFTHAFFKACLFLGSGSVSHAAHHSFDMKKDMGGLRKYMPYTFATFVIASLALAGIPPLAGFWSKDEILVGTGGWGLNGGTGGNGAYTLMLVMSVIAAAMTAAYMTRCIYLTFPLVVLAFFAVVAGWTNLPEGFQLVPSSWQERFGHYVEPVGAYFPAITHGRPSWSLAIISTAVGLLGAGLAYDYYFVRVKRASRAAGKQLTELPNGLTSRFALARLGYTILVNKFYLDWLYTDVIVGFVKGPAARAAYWFHMNVLDRTIDTAGTTAVAVGQGVYKYIDQGAIDGVVNGSGLLSEESGQVLRKIQTGKVQQYAAILFAGATVIAALLIVLI